jgi:hypothetical protein
MGAVAAAGDSLVELDPGMRGPIGGAQDALGELGELREGVEAGKFDAVEAIREYSTLTAALTTLDDAAIARVGDGTIGPAPRALREVRAVKEAVSTQQALLGHAATRGSIAPSELTLLRTAEVRIEDRKANFDAIAAATERDHYDTLVSEDTATSRERMVHAALGELGSPSETAIADISASEWDADSSAVFTDLGRVVLRTAARFGVRLTCPIPPRCGCSTPESTRQPSPYGLVMQAARPPNRKKSANGRSKASPVGGTSP